MGHRAWGTPIPCSLFPLPLSLSSFPPWGAGGGWINSRKNKLSRSGNARVLREGFNWFVTGQKTEKQLTDIFNLVSHQ